VSATERGRILHRMSVLMLGRAEELAQTEARDTGKPLTQARNDIQVAARYFEYYGAAADKLHGEVIPYQEDFHVAVLHEPYGVTAHILPWNYPAQMFGRSIAPALATGNAPVLKPAEDACLTPLAFCDIANEAGLPAGALNVVTGLGEEAGAALVAHAGVRLITFTGSPEVGAQVQKAAGSSSACSNSAASRRRSCSKTPTWTARPGLSSRPSPRTPARPARPAAGCWCRRRSMSAPCRRWRACFEQSVAGTPAMDRDCGPLINAKQKQRVEGFMRAARESGVPLLSRAWPN